MIAALCMVPILAAFVGIMFSPKGYLWLDMSLLAVIGFFIYPVINLIVIAALDVVSKKAIGTAAGFIGLFGFIAEPSKQRDSAGRLIITARFIRIFTITGGKHRHLPRNLNLLTYSNSYQ